MKFLKDVLYQLVYANDASLSKEILNTAKDIVSLEYAPEVEEELLGILENLYAETKSLNATADVNWQQTIKQNKEKQQRMKKQREEYNKKVKEKMDKGQSLYLPGVKNSNVNFETSSPATKKTKKEVEYNVRKMGNVLKVNFKKPIKEPKEPKKLKEKKREKESQEEFGNRMNRIKESLIRINELMQKLRSETSAAENREKIHLV